MANDDDGVPRRRSLIPGASEEIPVAHEADYPDHAEQIEYTEQMPEHGHVAAEAYRAFDTSDRYGRAAEVQPQAAEIPWYKRTWVIATAAGVIVVGAAIGIVLALTGGEDPLAAPTVSPSPSEASPSASVSPDAPTLLDDGIADDEYPEAAPRAGADYPQALVMEDWVWDKVSPTWTLVSVANYDGATLAVGPSVIYLASPEGVLFDLVHVNAPGSIAQVVSWQASERQARVALMPLNYDSSAGGALVDLETGAVEDMSFALGAGRSTTESFLAASAGGAEMWTAQSDDYLSLRFESWTSASGWTRVLADADISPWTAVASPDGATVAAEIYSSADSGFASARSGPPGQPVFVVFNVDTGNQAVVRPAYTIPSAPWCNLYAVTNEGVPIVSCWDSSYSNQQWLMAADGKPLSALSEDALGLPIDLWSVTNADIPALGISLVSAANDAQVYEVAVVKPEGSTVVLKAGVEIPYGGLSQFYAARVADGVVLVRAAEGCSLIDTENAHGVTLAASDEGIVGCLGSGQGNGLPPTYPYWGDDG